MQTGALHPEPVDRGRRAALKLMLAVALAPRVVRAEGHPRIGLALGSGGARGLAHVLVFEVLDELGLRPHRIAGSSIGAIMGALYASGMSAADIHARIDRLTVSPEETWFHSLLEEDLSRWLGFFRPTLGSGGLIGADAFLAYLSETTGRTAFEELRIPLQVVATDMWTRESVVLEAGELWPAVQASMAVPGLFPPVSLGERYLVDGGLTNPLPYDLLLADCDLTIAVDVLGTRTVDSSRDPSYFDTSFNTFQVMQMAILEEKLKRLQPDFLVRPDIKDVRVLEFYRFAEIFEQARPALETFRRDLALRLERS
ncbi:patatin-like phospholipase family protein [Thioalkalivibrio sulfidiphilus]|uniref:Patatin n=1 Tax=Thioalkalivibrio sulfidiphilus (strain HL-EbGR7) TaxID=396588 RepID=B8GPH8_THISH|nr:patatin-like phospholipase family protein [Thioalkalivibrio sulfidiphilus]ACL72145.1 Patatin [Thioalkalivibrio sulfidiphilus HL-EbGr7]